MKSEQMIRMYRTKHHIDMCMKSEVPQCEHICAMLRSRARNRKFPALLDPLHSLSPSLLSVPRSHQDCSFWYWSPVLPPASYSNFRSHQEDNTFLLLKNKVPVYIRLQKVAFQRNIWEIPSQLWFKLTICIENWYLPSLFSCEIDSS